MDPPSLPPEAQAAKVKQALEILSLGDGRLQEADRFLASIRMSPEVWQIIHVLIHSSCSQLSLTFAGRTLHMRIRADWLAFDDASRGAAFTLAVDGAVRCAAILHPSASPSYFFSRAIGFAMSQSTPHVRDAMWHALHAKFTDPILRCHVLAAVVNEIDEMFNCDIARHMETKAFCIGKVAEVVPIAISLLQPSTVTSGPDVARLRAGVTCLQAWCMYGQKGDMVVALIPVLVSPQLSEIVAETLTEIVGYSGTALDLLLTVCDGLILAFRSAEGPSASEVHHAIAEVACALSEGNADELMEQESEESRIVVGKVIDLLWLCLKSPDDRAFCAALEGWASWIAAENLVKESNRKIGQPQIVLLVSVVVQRMKNLQFIEAAVHPEQDDVTECVDEKGVVSNTLYEAANYIGIGAYVNVVSPLFSEQCDPFPYSICAALMALAIAGDVSESALKDRKVGEIVYGMHERVIALLESCTSTSEDKCPSTTIRRSALDLLSNYAMTISRASDALFYRAVRCAGRGIHHKEVCESAAKLLRVLAEEKGTRLVAFLPELLSSCKGALRWITKTGAEICVKALGRVAEELPSHEERMKAMNELMSDMCEFIRWTNEENKVEEHETTICRNLTLVRAALYEMNDSEASRQIFENLREAIFSIAIQHCGKAELSQCVCKLLEVCVLPTLLDDEDDTRKRNEDGRLNLAIMCSELAGECFKRSGPFGESAWLTTLGDLSGHVLWGAECGMLNARECLTVSVGRALDGLRIFCCEGYDTRADMTVSYLRLVNRILTRCSTALVPHANEITQVAMDGLRCTNISIVRESLSFWRQAFSSSTDGNIAATLITAAGGPGRVTGGVLCSAQMTRCASGVADVLYALCRVVGGGGDVTTLLQRLLEEGFKGDGVPREGLDHGVREMLFRGCYCSAGSKRELRRALGEVGRVCSMAIR